MVLATYEPACMSAGVLGAVCSMATYGTWIMATLTLSIYCTGVYGLTMQGKNFR